VLETDDEVRTAIESWKRGASRTTSVTCYLTTKSQAEDVAAETQVDNDGFDTTEKADKRWGEDWHDTKKQKSGKGKAKGWENLWHEGIQLGQEWKERISHF
jgi:hypothetical protein